MNSQNFKLVLDTIKARPKEWDQGNYHQTRGSCRTHCFAGWAQLISVGEERVFAAEIAMKWLELTEGEVEYLFSAYRKLEDFERFYAEHAPVTVAQELVEA